MLEEKRPWILTLGNWLTFHVRQLHSQPREELAVYGKSLLSSTTQGPSRQAVSVVLR